MTRLLFVSLVILTLIGCASTAAPYSDSQQATLTAQIDCLKTMATKLDDHRSGADVIGYAVAGACASQTQQAIYATQPPGISFAAYQNYEARVQALAVQEATQEVLLERKGQ